MALRNLAIKAFLFLIKVAIHLHGQCHTGEVLRYGSLFIVLSAIPEKISQRDIISKLQHSIFIHCIQAACCVQSPRNSSMYMIFEGIFNPG